MICLTDQNKSVEVIYKGIDVLLLLSFEILPIKTMTVTFSRSWETKQIYHG